MHSLLVYFTLIHLTIYNKIVFSYLDELRRPYKKELIKSILLSESGDYGKLPTFSKMKSYETPMVEIGSDTSSTLMTIEPDTDIRELNKLKLEHANKEFYYLHKNVSDCCVLILFPLLL